MTTWALLVAGGADVRWLGSAVTTVLLVAGAGTGSAAEVGAELDGSVVEWPAEVGGVEQPLDSATVTSTAAARPDLVTRPRRGHLSKRRPPGMSMVLDSAASPDLPEAPFAHGHPECAACGSRYRAETPRLGRTPTPTSTPVSAGLGGRAPVVAGV
jgi:hypothetical protein